MYVDVFAVNFDPDLYIVSIHVMCEITHTQVQAQLVFSCSRK